MEFKDAVKRLRGELGITQTELANAIQVNYATVSRWELGKTRPSSSAVSILLEYACAHHASADCVSELKRSASKPEGTGLEFSGSGIYPPENSALQKLIYDASFPIYICDIKTDELLYLNRKAEEVIGCGLEQLENRKCYKCIMKRDTPCPFCHKRELVADRFVSFNAFRPNDGVYYRVQGKLIFWSGRKAQVRYVTEMGRNINYAAQREQEASYKEQLRIRKQLSSGALATAYLNLTANIVSEIEFSHPECGAILSAGSVDDVLSSLGKNTLAEEEREIYDSIRDRQCAIKEYYNGKTHIAVRHYIDGISGYYETSLALIQNPITFQIEAFAAIRDITDSALTDKIVKRLLSIDYETILTINSVTGEARPFSGEHIKDVIAYQKSVGSAVEGVEKYLRLCCVDDDIERVVRETSLPYVKEQLEAKPVVTTTYSLRQGGETVHKRVIYTYLGNTRATILCAMQDLSETYRQESMQRDRIASALETLQGASGLNLARYDLKSKTFYSNSELARWQGYADAVENVPEEFIEKGLVAPECVADYRAFFEKLRAGVAGSISSALKTPDGSFRWFRIHSSMIFNGGKKPYQAVLSFQDVDEHREQAAVYAKWKGALERRDLKTYTLFRCNLSMGSAFDKVNGTLITPFFSSRPETFNERTREYAGRFVHQDDYEAYCALMNSENLLAGYYRGNRSLSMDYRERVTEGEYRRLHVSVEMAPYPDSNDIEAFLLFENANDVKVGADSARIAAYDERMREKRRLEQAVADRMESALASGEFDVYMQPQFNHATGGIVGAEALVRWNDPEKGVILPGEFIPLFERNGFILKLDEYVWEKTAQYISSWMSRGSNPVPVSVNVSMEDIKDPALCKKLLRIVNKYDIPIHLFRLEIAENLFAEDKELLSSVIKQLHEAGFLIEMDDFGSGYSSLTILKDMPVDILKLDMKFFSGEDPSGRSGMIINAVLRMARWLGIPTIAKGVEHKHQADFLLSIGCPNMQGYFYEKPIPAARFEKKLLSDKGRNTALPDVVKVKSDMQSLWNPKSQDSQLFHHFMGPAVIFEYHNGKYEAIRMNRRFVEATGVDEASLLQSRGFFSFRKEDAPKFRKAVLEAIYSSQGVKVSVRYSGSAGSDPMNLTLQLMGKSAGRALLLATLDS